LYIKSEFVDVSQIHNAKQNLPEPRKFGKDFQRSFIYFHSLTLNFKQHSKCRQILQIQIANNLYNAANIVLLMPVPV